MSNLFRKRPVVIEAMLWTGEDNENGIQAAVKFCDPLPHAPDDPHIHAGLGYTPPDGKLYIPTLEGTMCANPGDWIIKGVKGEFYPCKPDIFEATYEPACATATPVRVEQREVGGTDYKSDLYKDLAADWPYTIAYLSAAKKDSIESLRGALQDVMRVWGSGLPNPAAPPIQQIERRDELRGTVAGVVAECPMCAMRARQDASMQVGNMQACNAKHPVIPPYLTSPIVFEDKNLGLAMVANWGKDNQQWVFKAVGEMWMSVRKVTFDDPMLIDGTLLKEEDATANPIEREAVERVWNDARCLVCKYCAANVPLRLVNPSGGIFHSETETSQHVSCDAHAIICEMAFQCIPIRAAAPKSEDAR